mgnify:CR=1 FL=1
MDAEKYTKVLGWANKEKIIKSILKDKTRLMNSKTFTSEEMKDFLEKYDPNNFHL